MLTKIDSIHLYTGQAILTGDQKKVYDYLKEAGVNFIHLNYADPIQHPEVFKSLNTWQGSGGKLSKFPFVIYTEVHDDMNSSHFPRIFLIGAKNIMNSNILELSKL